MTDFKCAQQPCVNSHEYKDGKCRFHYLWGGDSKPVTGPKKPKPIARESAKRAVQNRLDRKQNKELREKNPECQMKLPGCTGWAQGTQHLEGRIGQRLTDVTKKITACNWCNGYAESHDKEAKDAGVAISKHKK